MKESRDVVTSRRGQLPVHWLVALAVAALVLALGVGDWFIVKGLREAERQNAENLRQTEQAATEIRALIRGAEILLDREVPLAQRMAWIQGSANEAKVMLSRIYRDDDPVAHGELEGLVTRMEAQVGSLENLWPDTLSRDSLREMTEQVRSFAEKVPKLSQIADPFLFGEEVSNAIEMADATAISVEDTQFLLEDVTIGSREAVRAAAENAAVANEMGLSNARALETRLSSTRRNTLLIAASVVVVVMLVQLYSFRRIRRRIRDAGSVIDRLAEGELGISCDDRTRDEIGRLMRAVQRMMDTLSDKVQTAERIASRNLTEQFKSSSEKDTLGQALDGMLTNLNQDLTNVAVATGTLVSETQQVAVSGEQLARGASEQAGTLGTITSAMEQVAQQTQQNADSAVAARGLVLEMRGNAAGSEERIQHMREAMTEMTDASKEIAKIVMVIDEIAFQTNLLALNANIEAAQAGQAGKGFAIVAREVRNLAQRCAAATKQTADLIGDSRRTVATSIERANEAVGVLHEISSSVSDVAGLVTQIASASQEQAMAIERINDGLAEVNAVTQQTNDVALQNAGSSMELSRQADELQRIVSQFRLKEAA